MLAELSGDRPGADRVAADVLRGVLYGDLARQPNHAGFGGGVGGVVGKAIQALDRRDVDDRAAARAEHCGDREAAGAVDAGQVYLDHPLPARRLRVHHAPLGGDTGTVHQHVQSAEALQGRLHQRGDFGIVTDVRRHEDRLTSVGSDGRPRRFSWRGIPVGDHHTRARARKQGCRRLPDAIGPTRDDRRFTAQPHRLPLRNHLLQHARDR